LKKPDKPKRSYNGKLPEDNFSRALSNQGDEGKLMRILYLKHPTVIYQRKVSDESIRY